MAKQSNKTRTYKILVEIRDILRDILNGEAVYASTTRLDDLLDEMRVSVNTTEGERL